MRSIYLLCLCLVACTYLPAQTDSVYVLAPVEIHSAPLRNSERGFSDQSWDSTALGPHQGNGLDALLSTQSTAFIKSYGGGGLATTSIRGGSAGHTAVLWNGLPIESPMLGELDFSLIPLTFVDQVKLHYGGESSIWGSGAIGGVVNLNNTFAFQAGQQLDLGIYQGSFGQEGYQAKLQLSGTRLGTRTRFFFRQAENNFRYHIAGGPDTRTLEHAHFRQGGILQELFWHPHRRHTFSLHFWAQQAFRELPPTAVQRRNEATQADKFYRLSLNWQAVLPGFLLKTRVGVFREALLYSDPLTRLEAPSDFWTLMAETEGQLYLGQHQLTTGLHTRWTSAASNGYPDTQTQYRLAFFVMDRYQWKNWEARLSFRYAWINARIGAPVGSLSLKGRLTPKLSIQSKISRNYRFPTLNSLYWTPGGNPALKPEEGWSQELGMHFSHRKKNLDFSYSATFYNRHIQNWILWSVREGEQFWSANNIQQVWSRGLEQRLSFSFPLLRGKSTLSSGYDYTRSTNQKRLQFPALEEGSQLFYVPIHQAFISMRWTWQTLSFAYRHRYTGVVEGTNTTQLAAYNLGQIQASYGWKRKKLSGTLNVQLDNLWDVSYRVIEFRPMPGRNFQVGLLFNLSRNPQPQSTITNPN